MIIINMVWMDDDGRVDGYDEAAESVSASGSVHS